MLSFRAMSAKPEPFKVPIGRMAKMFHTHVKRPRIVSFYVDGKNLMAVLSCGHTVVYCRVRKWTACYQCPVRHEWYEKPVQGYREIPFTTTLKQ